MELFSFPVGRYGAFLAPRATGRSAREDLEDQITRSQPDEVQIDFSGVEAMTISFADEFIGRFFASLAAGDIRTEAVLLSGLNSVNQEAVTVCLERRELFAAACQDGRLALLGAPEYLRDTYDRALALDRFSALDLASDLDVSAQSANNRLKRLVASGALRRERIRSQRGGKEFAYTAPQQLYKCPS